MDNAAVRRPWHNPARVIDALRAANRFPILPVAIVLIVLVIPAAFAQFLAAHDPIQSDLSNSLEPPGWMGSKVNSKTVVQRVSDGKTEISINNARRLVEGTARGQALELSGDLKLGDEVQIVQRASGSWTRPLGTDKQGRDLLSRMIYGARVSLIVSLTVIAIAGSLGTALGIVAGYFGGWVDYLISRIIDVALAVPAILVALVLVVVVGPGMKVLIGIISGLLWSQYARLVRGETLTIMTQDYISRARVAGSSHVRIMLRHVLPNVINNLIVLATLQVGFVIIIESSLSFIGAGIPRPTPSWGSITADGRALIIETAWWVSLFPGLAIVLTVLSVNLLGDWLRDKLDPKLRQI